MAPNLNASSICSLRPRYLSTKVIALGAFTTFLVTCYTFSSSFRLSNWSLIFAQRRRSSCSPEAWSSGNWTYSPNTDLPALTSADQVFAFSGLEGCAADREFYWHLGTDHPEQWDRFPDVSSYKWQPSPECDVRPLNGAAMVKDMVENGGWLLLGGEYAFNCRVSLAPHLGYTYKTR